MAIITTVVMIIIPEIGGITITDTIIMGGMVHVITMADMDVVGKMNSAPQNEGLFFKSRTRTTDTRRGRLRSHVRSQRRPRRQSQREYPTRGRNQDHVLSNIQYLLQSIDRGVHYHPRFHNTGSTVYRLLSPLPVPCRSLYTNCMHSTTPYRQDSLNKS